VIRPQVAVVGCGYWGRNLVRAFHQLDALRCVVDVDPAAGEAMARTYGVPAVSLEEALGDPVVDGVVVAVPAARHVAIASRCLEAGKHLLVEKPLALRLEEAEALCAMAEKDERVLMVGHVLRYHPAFLRLEAMVRTGQLGPVRYLYANRLNMGRIRREEDILWSFAPHDVSMILGLIGAHPTSVLADGGAFLSQGVADVTTTHLRFPGGEQAHVFVSWLHPFKEQKLVVVGETAMAVFDDGQPWPTKLQLFHHTVDWREGVPEAVRADAEPVVLEPAEPLAEECRHFLDCIASGETPRTDGWEGVAVLRVLEEAARSLADRMEADEVNDAAAGAVPDGIFVHPSAYVDSPCEIGEGTRVWHFSHLLAGTRIGRDCTIGQNVMIGPDVTVGDRCKIQNNVSLYQGVTLEDEVFCGPSCVFTNVAHPRAGIDRRDEFRPTLVGRGASIGANATIVCGHRIGPWALVAAGAVVAADVPAHALVAGVPARRIGWVGHAGERLDDNLVCPRTGRRYALEGPDRLEEVVDG
jgi:UDP-2-acetamido-3-amino-2,3-dideoxy-glucuronate N-acetyltransferase